MRKPTSGCTRAGAAAVALAVLGLPLLVWAGDESSSKSRADSSSFVKQNVYRNAAPADTVGPRLSPTLTVIDPTVGFRAVDGDAIVRSTPASGDLRAPGDNNVVLYDFFSGNIVSGDNNAGDDWVAQARAPQNQAYVIDEVSFGMIYIAETTVDTWVRINVYKFYDLDAASVVGCNPNDPVHDTLMATVIVNLGHPATISCTTFDRLRVNFVTGQVWNIFDDVEVTPNGIVSNTSPIGSLPAGTGEFQGFITFEYGRDIGGGVFGDGVTDQCNDNPSGQVIFGNAASELVAGAGNRGFYVDGFSVDNGLWECDEGPLGFGFARNGVSFKITGSLGPDCNSNGWVDVIDIAGGTSADINVSGIPDECELADNGGPGSCTPNGLADACDTSCAPILPGGVPCSSFPNCGQAPDCNVDGIPDACQLPGNDCNANNNPDDCDIASLASADCQPNGIPDECDVDPLDPDGNGTFWRDCDKNIVPDACERVFTDCNKNGIDDFCDIITLEVNDVDLDGVPDACGALGRTVVMDFEDIGSNAFDYTLGPVNNQPDESLDPQLFFPFSNFYTWDADLNTLTDAGLVDVTAGSVGATCGGSKKIVLHEITSNGTPQSDWSLNTPHIFRADPNVNVVFSDLPAYQEMSMWVTLNNANNLDPGDVDGRPDTTLDWDLYFGSAFAGPADSPNTVTVNDFRVVVTFNTDTTVPGMPTEIQLFAGDGTTNTGVDWEDYLGQPTELRVVIDLRPPATDLNGETGKVFWDGVQIATFTPQPPGSALEAGRDVRIMDKLFVDQFRNTPEAGFGGATLEIDCITLIRDREFLDCADFGSVDCDGNGLCDNFETDRDLDGNGILDTCEGLCIDCNHNGLSDLAEIAGGSAPDTDLNGVIDYCERTTHAQGFEAADGFAVGTIEGQNGYHAIGIGAFNDVTSTPSTGFGAGAFPRQGTQYLAISNNLDFTRANHLLFAPRQDTLGDADIELWSWDWGISTNDFARIMVEIGDLCGDAGDTALSGDGTDMNINTWINNANAGLQLRANIVGLGAAQTPRLYALQNATADHSYIQLTGVGLSGVDHVRTLFTDGWQPAGLRILNSRGQIDIMWAKENISTQASFIADPFSYIVQTFNETIGNRGGTLSHVATGGDRQIVIRAEERPAVVGGDPSVPIFGLAGTAQFYFDDFRYTTATDCDADGFDDAAFLAGSPEFDVNNDGIPDNCQDCDGDCPAFPITAPQAAACLDPLRLGVVGDCNNNGIPDNCDVNDDESGTELPFQLPYVTMLEVQACLSNPNALPNGECFESRRGGGSCDLNSNGTPDECEGVDCNGDGCLDAAEIDQAGGAGGVGGPLDLDNNGELDECQPDCNNNGRPDGPANVTGTDLNLGNTGNDGSQDNFPVIDIFNNGDGIPDECCIVCDQINVLDCVVVPADGDLDRDGDVDAQDYQHVQDCAGTNPDNPFPHPAGTVVGSATGGIAFDGVQCGCADINGDGLVNALDNVVILLNITGPQ